MPDSRLHAYFKPKGQASSLLSVRQVRCASYTAYNQGHGDIAQLEPIGVLLRDFLSSNAELDLDSQYDLSVNGSDSATVLTLTIVATIIGVIIVTLSCACTPRTPRRLTARA